MATRHAPVRQPDSEDCGAQLALRPDWQHERVARTHDHNAETFERYALLLDRYGAHQSANTERRLADDERRAAAATRQRTISGPGTAGRDVSLQPARAVR